MKWSSLEQMFYAVSLLQILQEVNDRFSCPTKCSAEDQ